jgi:hypothetical protein
MTHRSFLPLLTIALLCACTGSDGPVRKGPHTATGLLRLRNDQVILSDCSGQLVRMVGTPPNDLQALVDSLGRNPGAIFWLELDGTKKELDPNTAATQIGNPFEALGILSSSDSLPCAENWIGSYYDTQSSRVAGKSGGKLALSENNEFTLSLTDLADANTTVYSGRWYEEDGQITLKNDTLSFVFAKTGPRRLSLTTTFFGRRLEFERD